MLGGAGAWGQQRQHLGSGVLQLWLACSGVGVYPAVCRLAVFSMLSQPPPYCT